MIAQPYLFFAEDDDDDFDLMKAAFKECCSLKLVRAKNGETALNMLRTWATAFPFTRTLPRLILPEYNSTPILIYTTTPEPRNGEFIRKRNAAYIPKPKMMSELTHLVTDIVTTYLPEVQQAGK